MSEPGIDEDGISEDAAILAVDDHPANLIALKAILEPLHCRVVTAQSGPEALEAAKDQKFAVVLLDVMMPGMDGFQTLDRMRQLPHPPVPVIMLTAYELNAGSMDKVWRLGQVDYILKPIPPELLRSKVAAFVSLHQRGEDLRRRDEALATKDRHIAMLAHDLQSPLAAVVSSTDLLLRGDLGQAQRRGVERVRRSATRMSEMIRSLTDYARAGRGPIPILPTAMDLCQLCREVVEDFQDRDPARGIDLACSGTLTGEWDRNRLYQALSNLLANALRYGVGDVAVRAQDDGDRVAVTVHNAGPPIPADRLPAIFRAFERGPQDREGLGLGLYIVRVIARAHRGEVSVTSSAEAGTAFTIRLPRVAGPSAPAADAAR
jgi:signal transduction histidine kinase